MNKKVLALVCVAALLVSCFAVFWGVSKKDDFNTDKTSEAETTKKSYTSQSSVLHDMRGAWLTYFEISTLCSGKSESEYREGVTSLLAALEKYKVNTVFYQARAFADALYYSDFFPTSKYITDSEGQKPDYDPLRVFIECAKEFNIDVHAWVNPYRISYVRYVDELPSDHPVWEMYSNPSLSLIECESGVYYDPANDKAKKLLLDGIRELLENYEIKGVQFDDYFYPIGSFSDGIGVYDAYLKAGGKLSVGDFRKYNVSETIASVYALVKSYDTSLLFGVSPSANLRHNAKIFADVQLWCSESGYIDYIMPQIYYGFKNETMPFEKTVETWVDLVKNKDVALYCGLALYKSAKTDENAGIGQNEWCESSDILARQYEVLQKYGYDGFALYSCSYVFGENASENSKKEITALCDVIK